jgi:hypothetical protein
MHAMGTAADASTSCCMPHELLQRVTPHGTKQVTAWWSLEPQALTPAPPVVCCIDCMREVNINVLHQAGTRQAAAMHGLYTSSDASTSCCVVTYNENNIKACSLLGPSKLQQTMHATICTSQKNTCQEQVSPHVYSKQQLPMSGIAVCEEPCTAYA